MAEISNKLKGWQAQTQKREKELEEEKIDLREDGQSEGVDVNGDGVVDANDVHYSPDKKQCSSEKKEEESEVRHRGFRR